MKIPLTSVPPLITALLSIIALTAGLTGIPAFSFVVSALGLPLLVLLLILGFTETRLRKKEREHLSNLTKELERHRRTFTDLRPLLRLLAAEDRAIMALSGLTSANENQEFPDPTDPLLAAQVYIAAYSGDRGEALHRALSLRSLVALAPSLLEIQARIPYIRLLLERVAVYTEQAALTLLERFEAIFEQSDAGARGAKEAMAGLTDHGTTSGKAGLEALINRSHLSIVNRGKVIQEFISINQENSGRIRKISDLVTKTESLIIGIEDIAERSKLITFNLAVESAKIGMQGQGFRVIVTELQKLNGQTTDFAHTILQIVKEFKTHNAELLDRWIKKSDALTQKVRDDTEQAENTLDALKDSYELTRRLFSTLSDNAIRVHNSMSTILSSLQFQDITKQQIEGAGVIIADIEAEVDRALSDLRRSGYAVNARAPSPQQLKEIYAPRLKVVSDHVIFDILSRRA